MKRNNWKVFVYSLCVLISLLYLVPDLEAGVWWNGHIAELRPNGLMLRVKFYPLIDVYTSADTKVLCKSQVLHLSDLQVNDLVTVEGRYRRDGSIDATKITIQRKWLECGNSKGSKPAHCNC